MEFVDGITLSSYIKENPFPWGLNLALKMLGCLTVALSNVSTNFVIHRDIHPGNIILKKGFTLDNYKIGECSDIAIMDYGCFKKFTWGLFKPAQSEERDYLRHFGAISSWSPEFLKDPTSVDLGHDIWALGVLFYRMLTNKYPVWGDTFFELYEKLVSNFSLDIASIKKLNIHRIFY